MNLLVHVTEKSHDKVRLAQQLQDGWKGLVSSLLPLLSALFQVCLLCSCKMVVSTSLGPSVRTEVTQCDGKPIIIVAIR